MHLYEISPIDGHAVLVVARTRNEAADLFVTWSATNDRVCPSFTVDDRSIDALLSEQQDQVLRAFTAGLVGIVHRDQDLGWTFSPPMWQPLGANEAPIIRDDRDPVMRIFQMRDLTPIEAFVLAEDYDRALAIFEMHLRAHGGDTETVLYRELELQHLDEPANDAVYEALEFDCEGLVTCDANGQWAFVSPVGGLQTPPLHGE